MKINSILKRSSFLVVIVAGMLVGTIAYGSANYILSNDKKKPSPNYPKNASGETYGSSLDAKENEKEPDLIRAEGEDGTIGYVRLSELEGPAPKNPQEALALQAQKTDRYVNLYESDGKTVIGRFKIDAPNKSKSQNEKVRERSK